MNIAVTWDAALMIEAVSTSETSASIYQTTGRNTTDDNNLHIGRRGNVKSHRVKIL
jgi:hypothetical protein